MMVKIVAAFSFAAFSTVGAFAGSITSTATAPYVGPEDIAHLGNPTSDILNINGTGAAGTGVNDASTYVANDRTTQGQTFTISGSGTINGIWVRHAGYTTTLTNGTWSGLTDGTSIAVRILSVSATALTLFSSETATVATGSGIGGGGQNWGGSGMDGTGKWLHITLDTPVALPSAGVYAFDLTSTGPWFELAGLEAGTYADGAAYTTQNKNDLTTPSTINGPTPDVDHGSGDRTFIVDIASSQPAIPSVVIDPADTPGFVGATVTLNSQALGDPTPTYQWEYSVDGAPNSWTTILDATEATYQIFYAAYADNGYYRVVATNTNGSDTSSAARLTLAYPKPSIVSQPVSTAAQVGSDFTLSVVATGLGNLTYQWYKGVDAIGAVTTDNTLTLSNVQLTDAGGYSVVVSDHAATFESPPLAATTTTSNSATVSVFAAWSGLVSHEAFDTGAGYAVGELPGQNPTISGFTGAWTDVDDGNAGPAVASGSLIYANANYLGSAGDKVSVPTNTAGGEIAADGSNSGRAYRMLDAPLVVGDNTTGTRYLSFLFQSGQETGATTYHMLSLSSNVTGNGIRPFDIGITTDGGQSGTEYNFGVFGSYSSTGVLANTNVHLMVVKFELSATSGADSVTVWVDPILGSGEPAGGTTVSGVDLNWNRVFLSDYDGNSAAWDEIRWGSTFDSVTLNPNPAADYTAWILNYPGVGGLNGFTDDADGDGVDNGLENLFGTNPSISNQGIVQVAKTGNTVTFQHPQNATPASDISGAYVWSTDLLTFHAEADAVGGVAVDFKTSTTEGTTMVTATITGMVPTKLFIALKATRATP